MENELVNIKMKKRGRPTKENSNNSGELKSNLCRFTFIAEKSQVDRIKWIAHIRKISVKNLMVEILSKVFSVNDLPIDTQKLLIKTQELLSRKEVAEIFSVTPTTIRLWQINGVIHSYCNVNGRPRYHIDEVKKVINLKLIPKINQQTNP